MNEIIQKLLQAPCIFCGYRGEKYWFAKTHDAKCPWFNIASVDVRSARLIDRLRALLSPIKFKG